MTFFNHLFFENTLRQFYTEIYPNKPEIKKVLKHINLSDNSNFTFKTDDRFKINTNEIYENYYQKYLEKLKLKLNYISFKKQNDFPDTLWVIYLKDTTNIDYNISEKFNGYKVVDKNILIVLSCIYYPIKFSGSGKWDRTTDLGLMSPAL